MLEIKVGMHINCRYFNTPDNTYYGDTFNAVVIKFVADGFGARDIEVCRDDDGRTVSLHMKEVVGLVKGDRLG